MQTKILNLCFDLNRFYVCVYITTWVGAQINCSTLMEMAWNEEENINTVDTVRSVVMVI